MSYEPTLIIRKDHLENHESELENEKYCGCEVSSFLYDVLHSESIQFDVEGNILELVICQPELTGFNSDVRQKLRDYEIDFKINN